MVAQRQDSPSWSGSKRGKRRVHATLKQYAFVRFPGDSLFWAKRPPHFSAKEMSANRHVKRYGVGFANRYKG
jgi:hypothetical protein